MSLETATWLSQLVSTNPTSNDPKSQGDDHLRLLKSVLQNSFTNISGAVTKTHTELNSVTDRGFIAGQTWTGTHTFPATTYGVTAPVGDGSTKLATTEFVATLAFSSALPAQSGNADSYIRTNGTTASWFKPQLPVFQSNSYVPVTGQLDLAEYYDTLLGGSKLIVKTSTLWIAVSMASDANVSTSSDGKTWTLRAASTTKAWTSVAINGSTVLCIGSSSTTQMISTNAGLTWTNVTTPVTPLSVGVVNGLFVITSTASSSSYYTSTDGVTWTTRTAPATQTFSVSRKAVGGNLLLSYPSSGGTYYTSSDGINWTSRTYPAGVFISGITPLSSTMMIGSDGLGRLPSLTNLVFDTSDLVTWNTRTTKLSFAGSGARHYINELFGIYYTRSLSSSGTFADGALIIITSYTARPARYYSGSSSIATGGIVPVPLSQQQNLDYDTTNYVCIDGLENTNLIRYYSRDLMGVFL